MTVFVEKRRFLREFPKSLYGEKYMQAKQMSERVRDALSQLPDMQRDVLILRFYHELKIKEIAQITNTGNATVKSRLRQGMEKMKRALGEEVW